MAAARPVVATSVGGVPDIVEHDVTGLLVPARDSDALAGAITTLLADPDRREQMGHAARKRAYPAYSSERLVTDVEQLYLHLLGRR